MKSLMMLVLLVGVSPLGFGDPFPTPQLLSVTGQCPETVITWTTSGGDVPFYLVILNGPQGPTAQIVMGTRVSFFELVPGEYSVMVKAGSTDGNDSPFSAPYAFTIRPCVTCTAPAVQVLSGNPAVLWPPNGKSIPVTFTGTVTGITPECPLTRATYGVTDSQGDPRQGRVYVNADGSFSVTVSLPARRAGDGQMGRVYTFSVTAINEVGQTLSNPVRIEVPHDQGH